MTRSLGLLKPDCQERKLTFSILGYIQGFGLNIVSFKTVNLTEEQIRIIWKNCTREDYFPEMLRFMMRSPSVVFIVQAENAVERLNNLVGNYNPKKAETHTIRHLFGTDCMKNIIHSSSNKEEFVKEYELFF